MNYDVIVAGGGAAGVGAAVGAARAGARVALIERAGYLGGAATQSTVLTYCGFWTQSDPAMRVVDGVGGEVLREIDALGGDASPVRMGVSNVVIALLDPEIVKYALDRVCERAGVDVFLHSTVIRATGDAKNGEERAAITSVTRYDHGGTTTHRARAFVEASGDSDLAAWAGATTRYGDAYGHAQNGTMVMRFGGIDPEADVRRTTWEAAVKAGKARGLEALSKEHGLVTRIPGSNDVVAFLADEGYDVRDARSISAAERHGRQAAWSYLEAIRALPGHERAYLVSTGPTIGTRESRHVVAQYQLRTEDVLERAHFDDAIAVGGWPVEYHPGAGEPNVWRRIRDDGSYEIPLRTLQSASHRNLFAAGRTIDAETHAFASARVMGTAFATGHAAGIAAALVAAGRDADADADAGSVRDELRRQNAIVEQPGVPQ